MIPYKAKTKTVQGVLTSLEPRYSGLVITIQALRYSSTNPSAKCHIFDADGDEVMTPLVGATDVQVSTPRPITVKAPLKYLDEEGGNDLTIFGYASKIEV